MGQRSGSLTATLKAMFEAPTFTPWSVLFTATGAAVIWGKMGRTKLKAYYLSDIVRALPLNRKLQSLIEFIVFVTLGCLVGIGVAQPVNVRQALTAGIAWTSFFAVPRETSKSP
jgi:hypothetical protein